MHSESRVGDWMQTATGRKFWPLDPRPEDVAIEDIAHALSHLCRFGGHCRTFYSVAEHSVRVSLVVEQDQGGAAPAWRAEQALAALLHDAAEAYIVDVPRPIKRFLGGYKDAEERVFAAIAQRFRISSTLQECVKYADEVLLATEARDLMGGQSAGKWTLLADPLAGKIEPWSPEVARVAFLSRFHALTGQS